MLARSLETREAWKGRFDWSLVLAVGLLALTGTLVIISAASILPFYGALLRKHFSAMAVGILAFVFGLGFNYQIYEDQWRFLYGFALAACTAVLFIGSVHKGGGRWIHLPGFSVQVSEFARVALFLVTAAYLDRRGAKIREPGSFLTVLALVAPVLVLIIKQPDFSSALVIFPVIIIMLFCAGADVRHLLIFFGVSAVMGSLPILWTWLSLRPDWVEGSRLLAYVARLARPGWTLAWTVAALAGALTLLWWLSQQAKLGLPPGAFAMLGLIILTGLLGAAALNHEIKGYQRKRLEVFLDPDLDPRGAGYNVRQAQIAIGSGGMWGRGLFSGTQSKLGFLPERHTDFIFAVVGEELGFWGAVSIAALYLFVVWRAVSAARMARDRFGYLTAAAIAAYFAMSFLINAGMCLGFVPIAGIPLPFVSYGGSNLVACLWSVGILESIYARRFSFG